MKIKEIKDRIKILVDEIKGNEYEIILMEDEISKLYTTLDKTKNNEAAKK